MSFVIPLLSVPTKDDALKHSYKAMELGADGIIFQGSLNHIEALSNAGIPVQGHIGLVPRKSTWTGGIRAVGKTIDEAKALFDFCSKYKYKYEVIAYSFFSKQVAIKLIKI